MIAAEGILAARVVQKRAQQRDLLREGFDGPGLRPRFQRRDGAAIRARRAAKAQIDTAGIERLQHAELLGDLERRIMREHHAARSDADVRRFVRDARDHDLGRGTGEGGGVVMLREPEAMIPERVAMFREGDGFAQRVRCGAAHADGD